MEKHKKFCCCCKGKTKTTVISAKEENRNSCCSNCNVIISAQTQMNIYLLTYLLTHSMEQSPSSEANQFSSSQEIPRILRNSNFHYHNDKCPPPVPTLSHINPFHALHLTSCRSIFIFSPHLHLVLPGGLFLSAFPTKTLYTHLLSINVLHAPPISFFSI